MTTTDPTTPYRRTLRTLDRDIREMTRVTARVQRAWNHPLRESLPFNASYSYAGGLDQLNRALDHATRERTRLYRLIEEIKREQEAVSQKSENA